MKHVAEIPSRPPVLLCDAGNTLVFFDAGAAVEVLRSHGVVLEPQQLTAAHPKAGARYQQTVGSEGLSHEDGWALYVDSLLAEVGVETDRGPLVVALRAEHDRFNLWRRVPAKLPQALQRLKDATPATRLGVVSNSEGRLQQLFDRLDLARYFEIIVDSALEGVSKPDPQIFARALARMHVDASDVVYVGDLPQVDVKGAHAAGIAAAVLVDPEDRHGATCDAPRVRSVVDLVNHWLD